MPIDVIASIRVVPGRRDELIRIFKENVPNVLAEEGCIHYYPTIDADSGSPAQAKDDNVVTIVERWESLAALEAHSKAPHMDDYRERVQGIVDSVSLKVLQAV